MKPIVLLSIIIFAAPLHANPTWNWQDKFSANEQQGLINWIEHAASGITALFGPLPYNYQVHLHRMQSGNGPCPWANTNKASGRTVHFHVNTTHSWETFKKDWTAPHELSHLMFPYLGKDGIWFAEGIASYLQYQIMYANHTISWSQGTAKLQERFARARNDRQYDDISIVELSDIVHDVGAYVRLYWGGAAYFLNVDHQLYLEKNLRLNDIIKKYLECCNREQFANTSTMMDTFNRLADTKIFTKIYHETVSKQGFPNTQSAMNWLEKHPPEFQHTKLNIK